MPRTFLALGLALLLALSFACGDDDDGESPSGSVTPSTTSTPTEDDGPSETDSGLEDTETPLDTSDAGKTPAPSETEGETQPPATAPGDIPTPGPTASSGTPAIEPADTNAFLASFEGKEIDYTPCAYNPGTALTNCAGRLFAIDPPIVGQDITCTLWSIQEADEAVACTSIEPSQTRYYDVQ